MEAGESLPEPPRKERYAHVGRYHRHSVASARCHRRCPDQLAHEGARRMLATVLVAEADAFVALWKDVKLPDGCDRVVRHGHGPARAIQPGIGPVTVRRAKVRDRGKVSAAEKIRFTSSILPKWARRTKSLDALLPILYLHGISTGDFQEVLPALLGKDAPNLSPAGDLAADGGVAGGMWCLAEARPLGSALRLCVGGRGLPAGANGSQCRMHAGADRRDPPRARKNSSVSRPGCARPPRAGASSWSTSSGLGSPRQPAAPQAVSRGSRLPVQQSDGPRHRRLRAHRDCYQRRARKAASVPGLDS